MAGAPGSCPEVWEWGETQFPRPSPGPRASLIRDSDAGSSLEPIILGVRKSPFLCLARLSLAGHGEGLVSCDLLEWKQWRGSFLTHKPCGSPA